MVADDNCREKVNYINYKEAPIILIAVTIHVLIIVITITHTVKT